MSVRSGDSCRNRQAGRLAFIDALRVAAVAFVIIHHAAQAYGPTGGFWPVHDRAQSAWFAPFYTANAAFGMGLLFLVAGYFTNASVETKGPARFLRERWLRIGLPLATVVLLVNLPAVYLVQAPPSPAAFLRHLYERGWQPIYLHLWFLGQLLLYSVAFAGWRKAIVPAARAGSLAPPGHRTIAGFVLLLALGTWVVRIRYPIDRWVPLLWIMPAEPAHLPQYVALFAIGISAHRGDWFRTVPTTTGLVWLGIGLVAYAGIYAVYAAGLWNELMTSGGWNVSSLLRSLWEAVIVTGLSIGLIIAFRQMVAGSTVISAASFGAYILHPPIVVALQLAIQEWAIAALAKFAIASLLGVVLSFAAASYAGKVPGVRAMLGGARPARRGPGAGSVGE
jgi:peptidoglycan/LPS O-acetylase OafA/YrhL